MKYSSYLCCRFVRYRIVAPAFILQFLSDEALSIVFYQNVCMLLPIIYVHVCVFLKSEIFTSEYLSSILSSVMSDSQDILSMAIISKWTDKTFSVVLYYYANPIKNTYFVDWFVKLLFHCKVINAEGKFVDLKKKKNKRNMFLCAQ